MAHNTPPSLAIDNPQS